MFDDPLLNFLAEGHRLRFIPFGGNGGDRLLQFCERRLVEESESEFAEDDYEADCLCYHGGGMFGYYEDFALLEVIEPGPEPLVFFPRACCWRSEDAFARYVGEFQRIGRKLIVFARDPVSHQNFSELQTVLDVDLRLSHDCAVLYSTVFDLDKPMLLTTFREPSADLAAVYRRTDEEGAGWPEFRIEGREAIHIDQGTIGFLSPEHTTTPIGQAAFLAYWSWCYRPRVVITDRLHVALARWLFGQDTILFPGLGHKVAAVWSHSIEPDPRNCRMARSPEEVVEFAEELGVEVRIEE